jgi:hypothetical protein
VYTLKSVIAPKAEIEGRAVTLGVVFVFVRVYGHAQPVRLQCGIHRNRKRLRLRERQRPAIDLHPLILGNRRIGQEIFDVPGDGLPSHARQVRIRVGPGYFRNVASGINAHRACADDGRNRWRGG